MSGFEWKDGLSLLMAVTNAGVIFTAGRFFQRIKNIETNHLECKDERKKNECVIFERLHEVEQIALVTKVKVNGGVRA